ncbi:MAG: ABC transporter permease [Acidobacteria bacterium]|nr:ABC transporter permease [Acidobacteriota bacterium]
MRALWKRRQLDRDLRDEMAFHLAMREQKLRPVFGDEARYAARRAFGNTAGIEEETRMLWTFRWLEQLGQDLRYAARSFRKSPAMTAVVVLSLALGIGANTAIFSLIDAVLLRMLPVAAPQELLQVQREAGPGAGSNSFTYPLWEAIRDRQDVFSVAFAWSAGQFDMAGGGAVQNVDQIWITGDYFSALGVNPAAGRLITNSDDRRGCAPVTVLSYGFWQSHYGGSPEVLGKSISLNHQLFQVIGVSARGFTGVDVGSKFDVAVPACASAVFDRKTSRLEARSWWWLAVIGRAKPGLTQEQVRARLAVLSPAIMSAAVPSNWDEKSQQRFLKTKLITAPAGNGVSYLRRKFTDPLNVLMAIAGMVLLIACANVASLMLARSTARSRELATRKAVGASRSRLVRQLLTESLLLSCLGAILGLLFARWGSLLLVGRLSTWRNSVYLDLRPDNRVLGFTLGVALLTGILVGLMPALRSTRIPLMAAMKSGALGGEQRRLRFRAGKWIVAAQVSLSLVLLIGGGLLLRSFTRLLALDIGFDRSNVLLVSTDLATAHIPAERMPQVYEQIDSRLKAVPGVLSVARSFTTPLSGRGWNNFVSVDTPNPPKGEQALTWFNFVSPDYFVTMRTAVVAGRSFDAGDTNKSAQVAIINQTMAKRFFPGMNALGRQLRVLGEKDEPGPPIQIVGVVKDAKYDEVREEMSATAFFPIDQMPERGVQENYALRTALPPADVVTAVQRAVAGVNGDIPLEFHTLARQVEDDLIEERLLATLSAFFGGLALLLAMIGLYGVLSYLVTQRRAEFGIRTALGAKPLSILQLVMRDTLAVVGAGIMAGLLISFWAVKLLQKMLFSLTAHDAFTTLGAVGILAAVGLVAGFVPARRAARVDPMVALRCE